MAEARNFHLRFVNFRRSNGYNIIPQNGKIDKAEHVMADYWQREEVDVILFRDTTSLMLTANLELLVQVFLKYVFK